MWNYKGEFYYRYKDSRQIPRSSGNWGLEWQTFAHIPLGGTAAVLEPPDFMTPLYLLHTAASHVPTWLWHASIHQGPGRDPPEKPTTTDDQWSPMLLPLVISPAYCKLFTSWWRLGGCTMTQDHRNQVLLCESSSFF
jgi:hypothetical protein